MGASFWFMMVVLKVPIIGLGCIVWWAIKSTDEIDEVDEDSSGDGGQGNDRQRRRPHPRTPYPRRPRRGPHGDPAPAPPPRVRSVIARARKVQR